jgi:HAD superfamily hydrolase (TIGR01450 family)
MGENRLCVDTLLLDIDGVIMLKGSYIPNISKILQSIIKKKISIKFVTNCSLHKIYNFSSKVLPGYLIEIIDPLDVLSDLIKKEPALSKHEAIVIGAKDIKKRIKELGVNITNDENAKNVFIFEKLIYDQTEIINASRAILNGAKLYCAGINQLFWYNGEVYPGVGAITEQVKFMTQADAIVLGKPSRRIYELALYPSCNPRHTVFIGDELHIDIVGAKKCGLMTAYIACDLSVNIANKSEIDMIETSLKDFVKNNL